MTGPMTSPATEKLLAEALALHRRGNLSGAMNRYVKVLQDDPKNADALYYCAVLAMQENQIAEGIKLARRTVTKYREELKIQPARLRKRSS